MSKRKSQGDGGNWAPSNQAAKGGQCPVHLGSQWGRGWGEHPMRAHSVWERKPMCMKGVREEGKGSEDHEVG